MAKGKGKGSSFEREVCKRLSLWVSHGKREDLFWRSSMSGGRATVGRKRGKDLRHHAGDISAVAPEGHALTDEWYVECKFYRSLEIDNFCLGERNGRLYKFWKTTSREARSYGRRPMLIAKQNFKEAIVVVPRGSININWEKVCRVRTPWTDIFLLRELLEERFSEIHS